MRALVLLVLAEFLLLVLLAILWLGGTATSAGGVAPPSLLQPALAVAAPVAKAPSTTPIERREVAPTVPDVAADDPLGILVAGYVRSTDGTLVEGARVLFQRDSEYHTGNSATPGCHAVAGLLPGEWKLTCRVEGFANYESTVTLDARAFQQIDVELKPAYVVRVKIQGADGKSVVEDLSRRNPFGLPYVVATETPLTGDLPPTEHTRLLRFGVGEWRGAWDIGQDGKQLRDQGFCGELHMDRPPPVYASLLLRTTLLQSQRIEPGQKELVFTTEVGDVLAKFGTVKLRLLHGVTGEPIRGAAVSLSTAQGGGAAGKTGDDGRVAIDRALPGLVCLQTATSP